MKQFEDGFTDEKIISYLCMIRVKLAKQRSKKHLLHLLTSNEAYNHHKSGSHPPSNYEKDLLNTLMAIMPSRKKWKNLGEASRIKLMKNGQSQKLSTNDKNLYSLVKTIKYYRKHRPEEPFVIRLNTFVAELKNKISTGSYSLSCPTIYPKAKDKKKIYELKEDEKNICRPLSLFSLKDRIVLSFTNNYLTRLFDKYFQDCSLAFRAKPHEIVNHQTAIRRLISYKNKYPEVHLWVAECDIKKFYDTINHSCIHEQFQSLIKRAQADLPQLNFSLCDKIFNSYLDCHSFNHQVLPHNSDSEYWKGFGIPSGKFGWIEDDIKLHDFYESVDFERIGVPQGGALSGLIANIVLDKADQLFLDKDNDFFYVRFCDDMILMHPDKAACGHRMDEYIQLLKSLKLAPHPCSSTLVVQRTGKYKYLPESSFKPFWNEKSKGPYQWGNASVGAFPWIGFVGYEVHFDGSTRVRKSSIQKELKKQREIVKQIYQAIEKKPRATVGTIAESAIHRLIGMSVGRIDLWNHDKIVHEMCWKSGFCLINRNKHSIEQIKRLDRSRSKVYYKLIHRCSTIEIAKEEERPRRKRTNEQIMAYNKPFSYYYHVIERKEE